MMNDEEEKEPAQQNAAKTASTANSQFGLGFASDRPAKNKDMDDSESSESEYDNTVSAPLQNS